MPQYIFTCDNGHKKEVFRPMSYRKEMKYRCPECGLWQRRDYQAEHSIRKKEIHLDYNNDPISHLVKKRSFKGVVIENLTPEPVFVRSEKQYHKLLKDTNSREAKG